MVEPFSNHMVRLDCLKNQLAFLESSTCLLFKFVSSCSQTFNASGDIHVSIIVPPQHDSIIPTSYLLVSLAKVFPVSNRQRKRVG